MKIIISGKEDNTKDKNFSGDKLGTDYARAYCDGFQTSKGGREIADGWGYDSVNDMVKHWPGGGAVEGGRDAHFGSEEADVALCIIRQPNSAGFTLLGGYDAKDRKEGGNGYLPISLQYRPYTAVHARAHSIAGGDPQEDFLDRGYKGKTATVNNEDDLDMVLETRKAMGEKPVIVCVKMTGPMVMAEFEPSADAVLAIFGNLPQALLEVLSGRFQPSGLLPVQIPKDMDTVETQLEDVPFDMVCHVDTEGNTYDFGFGMNWSGVIEDSRVERYAHRS